MPEARAVSSCTLFEFDRLHNPRPKTHAALKKFRVDYLFSQRLETCVVQKRNVFRYNLIEDPSKVYATAERNWRSSQSTRTSWNRFENRGYPRSNRTSANADLCEIVERKSHYWSQLWVTFQHNSLLAGPRIRQQRPIRVSCTTLCSLLLWLKV